MNLEKYPFRDIKDVMNRLQEELNELAVEAAEASKAISKMRRFGVTSFHKDGRTGIEVLHDRLMKLDEEFDDVTRCRAKASSMLDAEGINALDDWS